MCLKVSFLLRILKEFSVILGSVATRRSKCCFISVFSWSNGKLTWQSCPVVNAAALITVLKQHQIYTGASGFCVDCNAVFLYWCLVCRTRHENDCRFSHISLRSEILDPWIMQLPGPAHKEHWQNHDCSAVMTGFVGLRASANVPGCCASFSVLPSLIHAKIFSSVRCRCCFWTCLHYRIVSWHILPLSICFYLIQEISPTITDCRGRSGFNNPFERNWWSEMILERLYWYWCSFFQSLENLYGGRLFFSPKKFCVYRKLSRNISQCEISLRTLAGACEGHAAELNPSYPYQVFVQTLNSWWIIQMRILCIALWGLACSGPHRIGLGCRKYKTHVLSHIEILWCVSYTFADACIANYT